MAEPTRIPGDMTVAGALSAGSINIPANSIADAAIPAGANISYLKLEQLKQATYSQAGVAVSETRAIHVVRGVGGATVLEFVAGAVVAPIGAATVTFDLRKNGATILSAVINLTSATAAYALLTAAIASAGLVQGDVLTIVTVATAGGGTLPQGVFAQVRLKEFPV